MENPSLQHSSVRKTPETHERKLPHSCIKTAVAVMVSLLLSNCVYHRRDATGLHPLKYDDKDAEVVFPWRVTNEFSREYQLKILPSIAAWLGYPAELLEGISDLKFQKLLRIIPCLFYAAQNDQYRINYLSEIARNSRLTRERQETAARRRSTIVADAANPSD